MFELRPFERRNNRMTAYNPWDEMERAFFGDGAWNRSLAEFKTDIQDKGDSYLLQADLPGFKKEDIHIDLDGETMTIRAERHSEHEEQDKKGSYVRCERSYGSYERAFDVSGIDTDKIGAQYADGVLKLTMPKKSATVSAKQIEIM
ncbi:MAG: Hsp20/alpha crystallin family protein [Oscillospiraceae bacterium]|nr:Hsp20/alpha crystallin family protein [Oscillospiraceae bacterium]